MNNPVMQRQMFMATGMPSKKGEEGILSIVEDVQEGYEDRTPDNLEIIANNLRGDIRSMDERYLELASMVGEAAFETPEEVLALMQAQLQQQAAPQGGPQGAPQGMPPPAPSQQPGGIEALANASAPPQQGPEGMPPGMMPPGMPPGMPPEMPQGGAPQGIESLVAGPTEQAPVMRQAGSPPSGEVSRGMGIRLPPSAYPSYAEAAASYGRAVPTSGVPGGVYTQSILDMLKTEAPVDKSGRPIPFVDSRGRMYQPAGGTDPRMASRGAQFLPKSSYGPQAARALGPAGYVASLGLLGTEALMSTDRMAGELTGDSLGAEFGGSAASTPGYQYMPGVEPPPIPPPVDQTPSGLADAIPTEMPSRDSEAQDAVALAPGVTPPPIKEEEEVTEEDQVGGEPTPPPAPKVRGLKERAEERYGIYKDLLGDDKNMRQAQALFLLAEAALNVAGAKSKEKGAQGLMERVSSGLKGLPSGMAALGAQATREDRALKTAAITAAEQEMAAEAKDKALLERESLKLLAKSAPVNDLATSFKSRYPGYQDSFYMRMAKDYKSGLIKELPDTSEIYDVASGKILLSPLNPKDTSRVGYLDPSMPFTNTSDKKLSRATNKQRPELMDRISNNEALVQDIEAFYRDIMDKNFIGVVPSIQSGLTNITLPFFGDNPFANVPLQQQRNAGLQMNQRLREMAMAYRGRPSNWSEEQVNKYLTPVTGAEAIFKDKSQFFATLENFRQGAINEINRDYHRLFPDQVPLRSLSLIPLGDSKSPLASKDLKYLGEMFRVNPNREVFVSLPDGTTEKITAKNYQTILGQQRQ